MVIVMLGFAVVLLQPPLVLFLIFFIYAISGAVLTLTKLRKHREERKALMESESGNTDETDEIPTKGDND
jgi:CDP-diacylglycerol--serine O-phosphatidyltransferase